MFLYHSKRKNFFLNLFSKLRHDETENGRIRKNVNKEKGHTNGRFLGKINRDN